MISKEGILTSFSKEEILPPFSKGGQGGLLKLDERYNTPSNPPLSPFKKGGYSAARQTELIVIRMIMIVAISLHNIKVKSRRSQL